MSYIFPSGTKRNILADSNDFNFEKGKENDEENKDVAADEKEKGKEEDKEDKEEATDKKDIAEENQDAVVEDKDFAFDAIKDLPGIKEKATGLLDEIKEKVEEVAEVIEETKAEGEEAKQKVEEIAAVVEDAKEAPAEVPAEAIAEVPAEVDEVEIEIEDDKDPKEVDISVDEKGEVSIPGVEDKPEEKDEEDDLVKKSKEDVSAKSKGEFIRLAKLSPKNREAVKEYWLGLGFPKDYVDAMVRDY